MTTKDSFLSLDELAKGNSSPNYYSEGVAQLSAKLTGADVDKNGVVDTRFLENELSKGTVGLWAGLTSPSKVSLIAAREQGSEELLSYKLEDDFMLDKFMPAVMPMIVSMGFGSGLAAVAGAANGSLASGAIKAGTAQAVNSATNGTGFNFQNFLLSALMKSNFKSGG